MNPDRVSVLASFAPVIRIAPTTAIAEMALVSDISGVCSSGETLADQLEAEKVASMKTYKSEFVSYSCSCTFCSAAGAISATRGCTISPPCVTSVSRMISSSRSSVKFAVLDQVASETPRYSTQYIWLA